MPTEPLGRERPRGVLLVLARVVGLVPYRALGGLGALLALLVGGVLRVRRRHVEGAMARAGVRAPAREAGRMYTSLGRGLLELFWFSARGAAAFRELVGRNLVRLAPETEARLAAARAPHTPDGPPRGIVLAATHTGNWDLAACAVAQRWPLLVITKRLSMGAFDAFWQWARAEAGVELAEADGALARGLAKIAAGGAVAMMIDQVPAYERHAIVEPFLGAPAWLDRAPALLALTAGAPLVVAAARRDGDAHVLEALEVLEPPPRDAPEAAGWVDEATRRASRALEAFVRAHPSQWLWMHRRWKRPPLRAPSGLAMPAPCRIPSSSRAAASRAASS